MRSSLALVLSCLLSAPGWAQTVVSPAGAGTAAATAQRDYRVGPGDLVSISVFQTNVLNQATRVSNSGKIHVTNLGILSVANRTVAELEALIAGELRQKGLVKEPWVQVRVLEYRAHPVYILGEVMAPGMYVLTDEKYLADLITESGGFNDVASPIIYLYRRTPPHPDPGQPPSTSTEETSTLRETAFQEAIPINYPDLLAGKTPKLNVRLRGGDVVYCPEKRKVYYFVIGDVVKPGLYQIPGDKEILLSQAIAQAGGPGRTAKASQGLIVRYDETGARQELAFDFGAVLKGKMPDIAIKFNDVVFVPGSNAKTIGYALLGIVPGVAAGSIIQR